MAGMPSSTFPKVTNAMMVTIRNTGTPPGNAVMNIASEAEKPDWVRAQAILLPRR